MKFSVLLPTRNRLELLRLAVETVRLQDDADWEIVISDNASQEDVRGFVQDLSDPRVVYVRSDASIPVTDNWNLALSHCTGDYIVMLGDDDGLLPGYFSRARHLIEKHENPEVLYTGALLYAYPGVIPGIPDGFLRSYEVRSVYRGQKEPFLLSHEDARRYVDASLDFRVEFDYNMQFFLVSRAAVERLQAHGAFYQSPYPDYYAANALLLVSPAVLVVPEPMVVVGISPKSFGFYYFNDQESAGTAFLDNMRGEPEFVHLDAVILPGTDMNTCWLISMETLAKRFHLKANHNRYRELQIRVVLAAALREGRSAGYKSLSRLRQRLTMTERLRLLWPVCLVSPFLSTRLRQRWAKRLLEAARSHPVVHMPLVQGSFGNMLEVFRGVRQPSKPSN